MHQHDLNQFIANCKKQGLNVTSPRMAIYKMLLQYQGHPSADDIYAAVKREHPHISLATVYKTMELLAETNLISKVTPLHDVARYDCNKDFHHHFVCKKCKKIVDIDKDTLDNIPIPSAIQKKFNIENYQVQLNGICKECQQS